MSAVWRRAAQLILEGVPAREAFRQARDATYLGTLVNRDAVDAFAAKTVPHPYDVVPARIHLKGGAELVPKPDGYSLLRDGDGDIVWIQWLEQDTTRLVPGRAIAFLEYADRFVHAGFGGFRQADG